MSEVVTIVRALAALDPWTANEGPYCNICGSELQLRTDSQGHGFWSPLPNTHAEGCVWLLADRWVASHG